MKKEKMCMDCGCEFTVNAREIKQYKSKKQHFPTHCRVCRSIRWEKERLRRKQERKNHGFHTGHH